MFRSIRNSLERARQSVKNKKETSGVAQEIMSMYTRELFGDQIAGMKLLSSYDEDKKQLLIEAPSKVFASEILMRSVEIGALFREKGMYIRHLVVR